MPSPKPKTAIEIAGEKLRGQLRTQQERYNVRNLSWAMHLKIAAKFPKFKLELKLEDRDHRKQLIDNLTKATPKVSFGAWFCHYLSFGLYTSPKIDQAYQCQRAKNSVNKVFDVLDKSSATSSNGTNDASEHLIMLEKLSKLEGEEPVLASAKELAGNMYKGMKLNGRVEQLHEVYVLIAENKVRHQEAQLKALMEQVGCSKDKSGLEASTVAFKQSYDQYLKSGGLLGLSSENKSKLARNSYLEETAITEQDEQKMRDTERKLVKHEQDANKLQSQVEQDNERGKIQKERESNESKPDGEMKRGAMDILVNIMRDEFQNRFAANTTEKAILEALEYEDYEDCDIKEESGMSGRDKFVDSCLAYANGVIKDSRLESDSVKTAKKVKVLADFIKGNLKHESWHISKLTSNKTIWSVVQSTSLYTAIKDLTEAAKDKWGQSFDPLSAWNKYRQKPAAELEEKRGGRSADQVANEKKVNAIYEASPLADIRSGQEKRQSTTNTHDQAVRAKLDRLTNRLNQLGIRDKSVKASLQSLGDYLIYISSRSESDIPWEYEMAGNLFRNILIAFAYGRPYQIKLEKGSGERKFKALIATLPTDELTFAEPDKSSANKALALACEFSSSLPRSEAEENAMRDFGLERSLGFVAVPVSDTLRKNLAKFDLDDNTASHVSSKVTSFLVENSTLATVVEGFMAYLLSREDKANLRKSRDILVSVFDALLDGSEIEFKAFKKRGQGIYYNLTHALPDHLMAPVVIDEAKRKKISDLKEIIKKFDPKKFVASREVLKKDLSDSLAPPLVVAVPVSENPDNELSFAIKDAKNKLGYSDSIVTYSDGRYAKVSTCDETEVLNRKDRVPSAVKF